MPNVIAHYLHHRPQRLALLQHIAEQGSITRAAKAAGLSYKGAWDAIDELNNLAAHPLVERSVGGKGGGGARLSAEGERLLRLYRKLMALQAQVLEAVEEEGDLLALNHLMLNTSARNQLHGQVTGIQAQGRNDRVALDLGAGLCLHATITHGSTQRLGLAVGSRVVALIKASWLTLHAPDDTAPLESNQLTGIVRELLPGPPGEAAEVRIALANGQTLSALAAPEVVEALALDAGQAVNARFAASSVLLGIQG
ncbi:MULTISPECIES: TOBE domain-containing protein [unclassified Pseudomonas]|uniref:TOBE domain-containing protein n=1 Tax=unclassified Pseudomonas TaxID=196821 RepID=UPI000BCFC523|nr:MULTISPECIES: TOBE domain-containing protein [unclassified Pseudomonas]PVZ15685.1 molybdate transport system regulatory protein [Pseudomonas sp. URIL14HWK12:I12]PVZ25059.1 molybdate transport system regulatory protein [Pseudomonas sp. URIL14HWK12:I10]PVZ34905.1 molybdate transport system regulatory protein [Pseudomonas sp. URIL14HWK12:I11]SNZ09623.1 molybdate transport system regulatory protein [Pseudomonas sp. URIL14HWK12:I9]